METKYPKWATLYTDASGTGGWAIWARYSEPPTRITISGECEAKDSTYVELYGIVQGVKLVKETWPSVEGIGVKCDSQAALKFASYNTPMSNRKDLRALQLELGKVLGETKIKCTWVKGHQEGTEAKVYINNWCDENARRK